MRKKLFCIVLCILQISVILSGCTVYSDKVEVVPAPAKENYVDSGVIAENGGLSLHWDADRLALVIYRGENIVWCSMPVEQYLTSEQTGGAKGYLESSLLLDYTAGSNAAVSTVNSYSGAFEYGRTFSYKVKNGIRLIYCFDEQGLAIPVTYKLINGSLDVSIDLKQIYEHGTNLYSISVLPYASSVKNLKQNKIFVPDGSGAILYCDDNRDVREYSESVYGGDLSEAIAYKFTEEKNIKLPVFAVSDESATYCTIIDKGESCAFVNATAGDKDLGYSYAYASFNIRGALSIAVNRDNYQVAVVNQFSSITKNGKIGERISIIDGPDEGFLSSAEVYRDYLISEQGLKKKQDGSMLYLDMPMAASKKEFVFGIPHKVVNPITTYAQAIDIIKDIYDTTKIAPVVRLNGVQSGGLDITKIAGGFKNESALGKKDRLNALFDYSEKIGSQVFLDYNINQFSKSGNGFKLNRDSAASPTSLKSAQNFYSISTGAANKSLYRYYLLAPHKLNDAANKLLDFVKKENYKNISLSSLGNLYYSDFGNSENFIGFSYVENAIKINSLFKKNKINLLYDSANQFAAVSASNIINAPTNSSNMYFEDEWLPFYQMVFKGYVPMSSESITISDDAMTEFLRAVQTGLGLCFTVCGSETVEYSFSGIDVLSSGTYKSNKDNIIKMLNSAEKAYNAVKDCTVTSFKTLSDGVCATEFSNGKVITVNYGNKDYVAEDITVRAKNFILR